MSQISFHIPEPCSENWNAMTVVDDQHRHCKSCDRVLVDFSSMTDDELMIFFKQNKGKVCGRFAQSQLDRSLTLVPEQKIKRSWWKAAALIPLSLFASKASAQISNQTAAPKKDSVLIDPVLLPDTNYRTVEQKYILHGKLTDKTNSEPLVFANIAVYDSEKLKIYSSATTDIDGNYRLEVPDSLASGSFMVRVSYIGYVPLEVQVPKGFPCRKVFDMQMDQSLESFTIGIIITEAYPETGRMERFWSKMRLTLSAR